MRIPHRAFYYLRHGETDWNVAGRLQGHTDIPLNANGVGQARTAAKLLRGCGITRIVASPLSRAWFTAEMVNHQLQVPLEADAQLKERSFGSFEGLLHTEIKARHGLAPSQSITTILPPDAEHWPQTCARMAQSIANGLHRYPHDVLLFVGHGANFRALYEVLCNDRREAANAEPYLFRPMDGAWLLDVIDEGGSF
jgi:broad specificity phosphatase PhoE